MGVTDSIKGAFVKSALGKLTDGDTGSTLLGAVAAGLLAGNLNYSLLVQGFHSQESAIECGKAAAMVVLAIWGWRTGKGKGKAQGASA